MAVMNFGLLAIALIPAIVLCVYVYNKDRVEKEPMGLLLKLFVLGAVICFPAAILEMILEYPIALLFGNMGVISTAASMFLGVALVEEGLKLVVLFLVTKKNREFDHSFDGLIYAVFVSLGFAALENVLYVLGNGLAVGIMRAVLSVPGHMFFAVMMGYYYSLWHISDKAAVKEKELEAKGLIVTNNVYIDSKSSKIKCLVVPILMHGFYNTCCSIGHPLVTLVLYAFVIFMYIHCFKKIKEMSKADINQESSVWYMLARKYPQLADYTPMPEEEEITPIL